MALTPPNQLRTTDPYSEDRYSSLINRFNRVWTRGNNVILEPQNSFNVTLDDANTLTVDAGIFIKDDAMVHVDTSYVIDASSNDYYEDGTGAMTTLGYYILVVKYNYTRSLPSPVAYYKLIRDETIYTGALTDYIFLGSFYVNGSLEIELTIPFYTNHPGHPGDSDFERPYVDHVVDGGELT